jgi:hypothetical protein
MGRCGWGVVRLVLRGVGRVREEGFSCCGEEVMNEGLECEGFVMERVTESIPMVKKGPVDGGGDG